MKRIPWHNPLPIASAGAFLLTLCLAASEAHAVIGDCNNNGVPDLQEPSWANRDDDGDGICNGADTCPSEYNPDQNPAACAMQAITVPWIPSNPSFPHSTYSGASTRVKGIARYGGDQFNWDFGDGTSSGWQSINGNPWNLGLSHVYTGNVGQLFIATLSVRSSSKPTVVATATYPVQIQQSSDLTNPTEEDVRVNMAIDEGLWNLHVNQGRSTYVDGAPGYQQPFGWWDNKPASCAAVDALELHGSQPLQNWRTDPYVEDVRRGLNSILHDGTPTTIGLQAQGNPDSNGNGIAIFLGGNSTYVDGICAVAVASSHAPGRVAGTGDAQWIYGRSYKDITQDLVDWFAYGQSDASAGFYSGGWWYSANQQGGDGSTNQWPILAMSAAQDNMGATVPTFVRQLIPNFINYTHYTALDNNNGGWGYTSPSYLTNVAKTAGGMLAHYFLGDSQNHPDVLAGLGFMYRHWNDTTGNTGTCWNAVHGYSYAMYGVMKSMRKLTPNILRITEWDYNRNVQTSNSFDWYYTPPGQSQQGLASYLTSHQNGDGSWRDTDGCGYLSANTTTAWDTVILSKGVTTIPPQAAICNCTATWRASMDITLDGSCSVEPDGSRHIVKWDWDWNYDGKTFVQSLDSYGFGVTGQQATIPGGFSTYTESADGTPNGTTHPIALRVSDDNPASLGGSQTSIATCNVIVKPPPNCPQVVIGGPYYGAPGVPVSLDGSKSFDVDGDPLAFAWDFQNKSPETFVDAAGPKATVTFNRDGVYPIGLQVTDDPAANVTPYSAPACVKTAYTTVTIGVQPPTANAGGPYSVTPNSSVTLDGSKSTDAAGNPITYAWDLTGNGLYNDSTAVKPTFTVGNVAVGTSYSVCLKVSDAFGGNSVSCSNVTVVQQHTRPVCTIVSPVVVASCTGGPQQVVVDGSRSYDLNGDAINWSWKTTCGANLESSTAQMAKLDFQTAQMGCMSSCTATLTVANAYLSSTCDAKITIANNTPPEFSTTPRDLTLECTPTTTAQVNSWVASAGAGDSCAPAGSAVIMSSNFVPNGGCGGVGVGNKVNVTWSAKDVCSNTGQVSASVTVVDTTPPVVTVPAPISVEATGPGTRVTFAASALDYVSGSTPVGCTPASGSSFPVGTTTVKCTSADGSGNVGTNTFTITITDRTPPLLALPSAPVVSSTAGDSTPVTFTVTAFDLVDGATVVSCTPASGSAFPPGITTVTCSSTDAHHNTATASFNVTVHLTAPGLDQPQNGSLFYGINVTGAGVPFTARGAPNATLTILDNGIATAQTFVADATGHYSGTITLAYGTHQISATQTFHGETSPSSPTVTVQIQPLLPKIQAPADGFTTTSTGVQLVGTGVPGGTLIAFDGATALPETFIADGLGNYAGSYSLDYGAHFLSFRQVLSGETSLPTTTHRIDVIPPAPALFSPANGARGTCDLPVAISGTAVAGIAAGDQGQINVFDVAGGNAYVGSIAVGADGAYFKAFNFTCGVHSINTSESLNGELSATGNTNTITLRPPAPVIVSRPLNPDDHAAFSGTAFVAPTPTTIRVYDGANLIYATTASASGSWTFDGLLAPRVLLDGQHDLRFTATINGQESDATSFSFMLFTQPPDLVLTPANGSTQTTATQPLSFVYASDYNPPAGVSIANVIYTFDGSPLYAGAPAGAPTSIDLTMLTPGPHTVTLLAADNLGNVDAAAFLSTFAYAPSLDTDIALTKKLLAPLVVRCDHDDGDEGDREGDRHSSRMDDSPAAAAFAAYLASYGSDGHLDEDEGDGGDHGDGGNPACRKPHLSLGQYKFLLNRLYKANLYLTRVSTDDDDPAELQRKAVRELWAFTQALLRDERRGRVPAGIATVLIADVRYLIDQLGGPPHEDDDSGDDVRHSDGGKKGNAARSKSASNDRR